jgi:hypothetical protein
VRAFLLHRVMVGGGWVREAKVRASASQRWARSVKLIPVEGSYSLSNGINPFMGPGPTSQHLPTEDQVSKTSTRETAFPIATRLTKAQTPHTQVRASQSLCPSPKKLPESTQTYNKPDQCHDHSL